MNFTLDANDTYDFLELIYQEHTQTLRRIKLHLMSFQRLSE